MLQLILAASTVLNSEEPWNLKAWAKSARQPNWRPRQDSNLQPAA